MPLYNPTRDPHYIKGTQTMRDRFMETIMTEHSARKPNEDYQGRLRMNETVQQRYILAMGQPPQVDPHDAMQDESRPSAHWQGRSAGATRNSSSTPTNTSSQFGTYSCNDINSRGAATGGTRLMGSVLNTAVGTSATRPGTTSGGTRTHSSCVTRAVHPWSASSQTSAPTIDAQTPSSLVQVMGQWLLVWPPFPLQGGYY